MNAADLIAFEEIIAEDFNAGRIAAPCHLAGGNEEQLIEIFRHIKPDDWVLTTWRAHYHCLLKGVPPALLRAKILEGRSIALCFKEYKILSSAIVGGICPIAVGLAWAIKKRGGNEQVWCFIGDMTAESGIAYECKKYTAGHELPVRWIIEDNGLSVCTPTRDVWPMKIGKGLLFRSGSYEYTLDKPHVGTGKWVAF